MLAMHILEFIKLSFYLLIWFMEYGKENKVFKINDFVHQKLDELKAFPTLQKPAIHERDLYMSSVLAKVAMDHLSVVAVVSKDHTSLELRSIWRKLVTIRFWKKKQGCRLIAY